MGGHGAARAQQARSTSRRSAAEAVADARADLASEPRDGILEAIRCLRLARRSALRVRSQTLSQIRALIVTAPSVLREPLRPLAADELIDRLSRTFPDSNPGDPICALRITLRRLAHRYQFLTEEIEDTQTQLRPLMTRVAPRLIALLDEETHHTAGSGGTGPSGITVAPGATALTPGATALTPGATATGRLDHMGEFAVLAP